MDKVLCTTSKHKVCSKPLPWRARGGSTTTDRINMTRNKLQANDVLAKLLLLVQRPHWSKREPPAPSTKALTRVQPSARAQESSPMESETLASDGARLLSAATSRPQKEARIREGASPSSFMRANCPAMLSMKATQCGERSRGCREGTNGARCSARMTRSRKRPGHRGRARSPNHSPNGPPSRENASKKARATPRPRESSSSEWGRSVNCTGL